MDKPSLIEFPCDFPIKAMGMAQPGFAEAIADLVLRFDPDFDPTGMTMRPSSGGKYLALTCTVRATSQAQLDDIYRALTAHPMVKVAL